MRRLHAAIEHWPLRETFRIARGSKDEAVVIVVTLEEAGHKGKAEAVPYARYGESRDSVLKQITEVKAAIEAGEDPNTLLPAGAARNALDCALWDLKAHMKGTSVPALTDLPWPNEVVTAQTVVLDTPDAMKRSAKRFAQYPLIKLKLDQKDVLARVRAVHEAAPQARLIIDANESWTIDVLKDGLETLASLNVALIEQPLPQGQDEKLAGRNTSIPLCADESCHTHEDVERLHSLYDAVNIKLDKTGGLSEAIKTFHIAHQHGLKVMIGCMVGTSLGIAPILGLAAQADFADIDGPSWLRLDRPNGLRYGEGKVAPPQWGFWGGA